MDDDSSEASLFIGDTEVSRTSFIDACKAVWREGPAIRAKARIITPDATYDAEQLESMRCEDKDEI
jgi:hypothetical protein